MNDNVEDCPVCLTAFDDALQRPRTLPCGHTFCTTCIEGLREHGHVTCPSCRVRHTVPEGGQFPVCYAFEAVIRRMRGATLAFPPPRSGRDTAESTPSPATGLCQKGTAGISRAVRSLLQEQEGKVLAAIRTCQEVQGQLDQYQTTLVSWGEQQQHLEDRLQALVYQSKSARILVQQEEFQVVAKKEQVQQGKQQLHVLLQVLRTVTTREQAYEAIDNADLLTDEERQRGEKCRKMFPDVHTITTIIKVKEASNAALEAAETMQAAQETTGAPAGAAGDSGLPTALASSITDSLEALLVPTLKVKEASSAALEATETMQAARESTGIPTGAAADTGLPTALASSITDRLEALLVPTLMVGDLCRLTQPTRNLLQDGLVFAVHHVEGQSRHARISLEDGRLYLHFLQDQPLPHFAVTMQMDEVLAAGPLSLVFLDLVWPGSLPRRVLIRLRLNTPRSQQFVLLCTGQRGPCYANTRLYKVDNDGEEGEYVRGGDYDNNDGTGGAALLPDLDEGEYRSTCRAGDVWADIDEPDSARFGITIRDLQDAVEPCLFGEVVSGLDGVAAASQHRPITEVTVVDCGVVLWA